MLQLLRSKPTALCDRISRRDWLRVGGLGILGLTLPGLLCATFVYTRAPAYSASLPSVCCWVTGLVGSNYTQVSGQRASATFFLAP